MTCKLQVYINKVLIYLYFVIYFYKSHFHNAKYKHMQNAVIIKSLKPIFD